jgi:hypothetical protein
MPALSDDQALKLGSVFAEILVAYDLTKNELRLGLVVAQKTFLSREISARLDFQLLAGELGGRESDWFHCFERLCRLGVVKWDQAEGIVQPNTDVAALSRERALRTAQRQPPKLHDALPLDGERSLDNALVAVNREAALASPSQPVPPKETFDLRGYADRFRSALEAGTVERDFPEVSTTGPPAAAGAGPPRKTVNSSLAIASAEALGTKASAKLGGRTAADAWQTLVSVDKRGARLNPDWAQQWRAACERQPDRVIRLVEHVRPKLHQIDDPWAYLSHMARSNDWRLMVREQGKGR